MIDTHSKTILLMRDDYPGCESAECDFIKAALEEHGYIVREITVSEFLGVHRVGGLGALYRRTALL